MSEDITPKEVDIISKFDVKTGTHEVTARQIVVKDHDKKPVCLFYKTPLVPHYKKGERSLSPDSVLQEARQKKAEYDSARICFGEEHVALTSFVVGEDTSSNKPETHIYQEKMHQSPLLSNFGREETERIKQKSLQDLDPTNEAERMILGEITPHQEELRDFYPSYIESVLLGFVPDLQHYITGDEADIEFDCGVLFSDNFGLTKDPTGQETVKIYDWGTPRYDKLDIESRRKLRTLIEYHKRNRDLPIHLEQEQHITKKGDSTIIFKPSPQKRKLANWYEEALEREIADSYRRKHPHASRKDINQQTEFILSEIKTMAGCGDFSDSDRYWRDQEVFRRFSGASIYGTPAVRTIEDWSGGRDDISINCSPQQSNQEELAVKSIEKSKFIRESKDPVHGMRSTDLTALLHEAYQMPEDVSLKLSSKLNHGLYNEAASILEELAIPGLEPLIWLFQELNINPFSPKHVKAEWRKIQAAIPKDDLYRETTHKKRLIEDMFLVFAHSISGHKLYTDGNMSNLRRFAQNLVDSGLNVPDFFHRLANGESPESIFSR